MKKLLFSQQGAPQHWVGDGFPVRSIFSYNQNPGAVSPFLLMDYAAPTEFPPSEHIRGVGEHPHRGFETVTIVYAGEVDHRDSHGGGGSIGPGDVQWMTAGSGLVHEEKHGRDFARTGGAFEMVQLWVNLPAKHKMTPPRYQAIKAAAIPQVDLPGGAGIVRIIAGEFGSHKGPASTFSPINVWDMRLAAEQTVKIPLPRGHSASVFVLDGEVITEAGDKLTNGTLGGFDREGEALVLRTGRATKLLVLGGEPILEPVVGHGPFVMNTAAEIQQAFSDYREGRMGRVG